MLPVRHPKRGLSRKPDPAGRHRHPIRLSGNRTYYACPGKHIWNIAFHDAQSRKRKPKLCESKRTGVKP